MRLLEFDWHINMTSLRSCSGYWRQLVYYRSRMASRWNLLILIESSPIKFEKLNSRVCSHSSMIDGKKRIIIRLELIEFIIWLMMRFDDLSMTYHLIGTHDKETESHVNYTLRFFFRSTRLPLHIARYQWWIVRAH